LVSFWLEWALVINERAFMALKKVLSNQILHSLNEWAQYIPPLSERALDYMKCLHAFHTWNALGNFVKCFVVCTPHSLIRGAHITLLQLFIRKIIPTGAPYVTLHIKIGWRKVNICEFSSRNWSPGNLLGLLRLVKNVAKMCTCKRRL
jgi:hypothetical protein